MSSIKIVSRAAVLLLLFVAANLYASADYYLKIEGIDGESKARIIRCPDGACTVDLPSGDFTVTLCDEKGNALTSGKAKLNVQFNPKELSVDKSSAPSKRTSTGGTADIATGGEVVSPRDAASGQASGKRMHKPIKITKEWDANTPMLKMKTPTGGDNNAVIHWTLEVRVDRVVLK
jgi:hypothetical protein